MINIAIITPARDEEDNIEKVYNSLKNIDGFKIYWLIVENGSSDNTLNLCKSFTETPNVTIEVISKTNNEKYSVGIRLSKYLSEGFKIIIAKKINFEYLSIVDADVELPKTYFLNLHQVMCKNKNLMLTSGKGIMNEVEDGEGNNHVRGNARIWRFSYIKNRKIPIVPSWDSVSKFHVLIDGLDAYPIDTFYKCRPMIVRQNNAQFYGYAAAFRGVTLLFAVLKSLNMIYKKQPGFSYFYGYIKNIMVTKDISTDSGLLNFVREHCRREIVNVFGRK